MQTEAEKYDFILDSNFDPQTQKEHQTLSQRELTINKTLKELIKNAGRGDNLFKNFKELSYLVKPNHLIEKPIIAVVILLNKTPKIKSDIDYMSKTDIDSIWIKIKDFLKDK